MTDKRGRPARRKIHASVGFEDPRYVFPVVAFSDECPLPGGKDVHMCYHVWEESYGCGYGISACERFCGAYTDDKGVFMVECNAKWKDNKKGGG